jgi:phosphoadenosine phosphosulfate reductase
MGVVYLGRLHLRWCSGCNLPVLESGQCGKCGSRTAQVKVTPPGDIRPAFKRDITLAREVLDRQFGDGCGSVLIPDGKLVLLNKCPSTDRMDEVIIDGEVAAVLAFEPGKGYSILMKPAGALKIRETVKQNWVVVDRGAIESIRKGSNAMAAGITGADRSLLAGNETLVYTYKDCRDTNDCTRDEFDIELLAVGTAKKSWAELQLPDRKGVGVKLRSVIGNDAESRLSMAVGWSAGGSQTWQDALDANRAVMEKRKKQAIGFIKSLPHKFEGREIAVSFSGGKDSLATLLLALDAGLKPKILFIDTGLEFPETIRHVRETASEFGLRLITESAGTRFWDSLEHFGPPGKDYRWCCKVCKLGPTSKLIRENFPDGVIALIGQRRYESEQRSAKGPVWRNAWVEGQTGASPIQDWTALHVWLYIFEKGAKYNPWYDMGLERIGCHLCPASDMGELATVREFFPEFRRWDEYLGNYYAGYGSDWLKYGLWRWRAIPEGMRVVADGIAKPDASKPETAGSGHSRLTLKMASGYQPCETGTSAEGVFSRTLDMERVPNMLNVLGKVEVEGDLSYCRVGGVTVFREGAVVIKDKDEEQVRRKSTLVHDAVVRAMDCVGCEVCIPRCRQGALEVPKNGKVHINDAKCIHCGECLGPCAVIDYGAPWEFWVGDDVEKRK